MTRYVALLRGINVGGHRVKMTDLKSYFEQLGLEEVETFIASGNVVFRSRTKEAALVTLIEQHLAKALGYEVPTFIRTPADLAAIAAFAPFEEPFGSDNVGTLSIMFFAAQLDQNTEARLPTYNTRVDKLRSHGREIYWLSLGRTSDSEVDWVKLGKELKLPPTTVRNVTTIRKLAAKYPQQ